MCVTTSSPDETPASLTDKMSVLLSLVTKFDFRQQACIKGMSRLADETVDLVVTSPPYNLGISYGKYSDRQDRQSYLDWCGEWAEQIHRRSEEHTSELQSLRHLVCRLLLEKKNITTIKK